MGWRVYVNFILCSVFLYHLKMSYIFSKSYKETLCGTDLYLLWFRLKGLRISLLRYQNCIDCSHPSLSKPQLMVELLSPHLLNQVPLVFVFQKLKLATPQPSSRILDPYTRFYLQCLTMLWTHLLPVRRSLLPYCSPFFLYHVTFFTEAHVVTSSINLEICRSNSVLWRCSQEYGVCACVHRDEYVLVYVSF